MVEDGGIISATLIALLDISKIFHDHPAVLPHVNLAIRFKVKPYIY